MVSFKVSSLQPEEVRKSTSRYDHFVHHIPDYKKEGCIRVLQSTEWSPESFRPSTNGFVHGVIHAYNGHHDLIIRPDDVWLAIATQFGLFVNANAESLRHLFVDHKGKKPLIVSSSGSLETADYGALASNMSALLKNNVKDERVCDWVLPRFSTTTDNDVIVGSVVLMATMKHYFEYHFEFDCGIPNVTLEGTPEDWEEIHRRVEQLASYGPKCEKWSGMLKPITGQFVESSKGKVDREFWGKICHHVCEGSGTRFISGWISVFCVFTSNGKWQGNVWGGPAEYPAINSGMIPNGYLVVDVRVNDNGEEHPTLMFAGHLGYEVVGELRNGVAPRVAWAIALRDEELAAKGGPDPGFDSDDEFDYFFRDLASEPEQVTAAASVSTNAEVSNE